MTDPRYADVHDEHISLEQENEAERWLDTRGPDMLASYYLYSGRDSTVFPEHFFTNCKSLPAGTWWKFMQKKAKKSETLSVEFTILMTNLHSCPASSASIERWFSTVGYVWSKVRNRLGIEKAKKLSTIYRHLRH